MRRRLLVALCIDPSSGSSRRSDYFAIAVVGLDLATMKLHALDAFMERVPPEEQEAVACSFILKWHPRGLNIVGVESIFRQIELVRRVENRLRHSIPGFRVTEIHRLRDKKSRLEGLAMRYSAGDVLHPPPDSSGRRLPWVEMLEEHLCSIGWEKGVELHDHDDLADAFNDACDLLTGTRGVKMLPEGRHMGLVFNGNASGDKRRRWSERMREAKHNAIAATLAKIEAAR